VERPFVLDFGGAYLDFCPEFSNEVWEDWEKNMIDVNPGNIGFAD